LEYLIREYGQHPAYYRLNGKPVIVIWASNTVPLATWQRIFTNLRTRGLDALHIAMGYNPEVLSEFDGLHEYGVSGYYRLGALYQYAAKQVRGYSLLYPDATPKIWIATLQPGFDERTLPDRKGFYWERRNGDSYRYTFEAAMKSDPDWLFITSWNEWWEHTYIEPSVRYGDFYLRLTKEFADAWKKR
jgi:glycoprotein endo-alpha-1,2-mannosidase